MMRNLKYDKIGLSIRLMLFTGLRKGEMLGLTKIHISEDGSIVTVTQAARRSKGKTYISDPKTPTSTRIIPVPKCAREYVILLRNCIEDGLIWSSDRRPGQPMNTKTFDQYYYEALDSINMRRLSPHRCRHSYVSMGKAAGIPLEILRRLAGHSNGTVTEDYMHIEQSVLAREIDKIDALFAEELVKA
jgi:integrase